MSSAIGNLRRFGTESVKLLKLHLDSVYASFSLALAFALFERWPCL